MFVFLYTFSVDLYWPILLCINLSLHVHILARTSTSCCIDNVLSLQIEEMGLVFCLLMLVGNDCALFGYETMGGLLSSNLLIGD